MPESSAAKTKIFLWGSEARFVPIPEGYYRVLSGAAKPTDLMLCMLSFMKSGTVDWVPVKLVFSKQPIHSRHIDCLIRKGVPVEKACPRCERQAVAAGYKFCKQCCGEIKKDLRSRYGQE
jgi:hypothetical protein